MAALCELTNSNTRTMVHFTRVLEQLIEMRPLSAITETDFDTETNRCTRRSSVYRADDGMYYDDQAVVYHIKNRPDLGPMFIYQGTRSSKRRIELPYIVNPQVVYLDKELSPLTIE